MTTPAELQAIRERDARDFISTKQYADSSAVTDCRADRRTLLALYDAQSDEVRRLRDERDKLLDQLNEPCKGCGL